MNLNLTALITGASSGIGAAISKKMADEGYDLILLGRNEKNLEATKTECAKLNSEIEIKTLAFDLKNLDQHQSSILKTIDNLKKPIDVLINNAGIFKSGTLLQTKASDWQEMFEVNLLSNIKLTQLIWPYFMKHKKGNIINISSTLGVKPTPMTGAYSAIKAAQINWTLSLAQEGGASNIRANCVCPGIVDTPIHSFHTMPEAEKQKITDGLTKFQLLNFIGEPQDVANAVHFLASQSSKWTTGSVLHVDGGINIK
ncbi:MAG: SDR family NAD(P)-dependent oxidoreductase [Pseudobdellovibrio sp.]